MTDFYQSREWLILKQKALRKWGFVCLKCGKTPSDGVAIHVDHVRPRSKYPKSALKLSNLQTLCENCNKSKGVEVVDYRMSKLRKALRVIITLVFIVLVLSNPTIIKPLSPLIAEYLGLLTGDQCEAQLVIPK